MSYTKVTGKRRLQRKSNRKLRSVCAYCRAPIEQGNLGREKVFCNVKCRVANHRAKQVGKYVVDLL